jgi:chromate transport protein ChrA
MTTPHDPAGVPAPDQPARPEAAAQSAQPSRRAGQPQPRLRPLLGYFLGLGTWGFGGPIATVGYMQRDLVERRGWLDRQDFLNGVALGQTMPGPLAAQVAMWVGYLQRGPLGALAVAVPFIAPSFLLVLAVAIVYVRYQGLPVVQSLFYGIAPAVMAIIAIAAVKLARLTNQRDPRLWGISVVLGTVTALTGAEIAWLFLAAGLLMVALEAPHAGAATHPPPRCWPSRPASQAGWRRPPRPAPSSPLACSSSRPARSSSARAWRSCRSCAKGWCTSTTG